MRRVLCVVVLLMIGGLVYGQNYSSAQVDEWVASVAYLLGEPVPEGWDETMYDGQMVLYKWIIGEDAYDLPHGNIIINYYYYSIDNIRMANRVRMNFSFNALGLRDATNLANRLRDALRRHEFRISTRVSDTSTSYDHMYNRLIKGWITGPIYRQRTLSYDIEVDLSLNW